MEFHIDQTRFSAALTLAATVANHRSTMPVLANVLLEAKTEGEGELVCSATDMMISITEHVPARVSKAGSLTIGVRHLLGVVKTLPGGDLSVKALDNHWAQIDAARSEFRLMGMPQADFPDLPDPKAAVFTSIPAHLLADLIQKTLFSVSTDEARVNLNGALFESDGKQGTMVSTDGHRLTKFSVPLAGPTFESGIIVPRKGMMEIRRVLDRVEGDCEIAVGEQHLFVRTEGVALSIKLNSVAFPPYQQVIPGEFQRSVDMGRDELLAALRRAEVMAPEKTATVRLELSQGNLKFTADNPDLGVAHQDLPVDYDGEGFVAGFNATYLIAAAEACDGDKVRLEFQGELDPCVIRPVDGPDFLAVVMPMRI